MDAVVVGQIARDLVLVVDEVPEAGTAVPVRQRREMFGGKGANQAVGLAQLDVRVALLGVVGQDETGDRLLDREGPGLVALAVQDAGNAFVWVDGDLFLPLEDVEVADTWRKAAGRKAGRLEVLLPG
jgi:hypothetical protein